MTTVLNKRIVLGMIAGLNMSAVARGEFYGLDFYGLDWELVNEGDLGSTVLQ